MHNNKLYNLFIGKKIICLQFYDAEAYKYMNMHALFFFYCFIQIIEQKKISVSLYISLGINVPGN